VFTESENLVVVEGWTSVKDFELLEKKVKAAVSGGTVVVERVATTDVPPTKLDNPKAMQPFEFLVRNLSTPHFDEIDPTFLVFLSFPLFFGMILGDIAYGIVLVFLSFAMKKLFKKGFFNAASGIMLLSAFWTIVFGVVFGEFLGAEHILGYELHPLVARAEEHGLILLMQLCVLVGFLHVLLGFIVGAYGAFAEGHKKHGYAKIAWVIVTLGLVGFIATSSDVSMLGLVTPFASFLPSTAYLIALIVGVVGLSVFEGINAVFEIPGLVSNIVSYLRIMAIGVSGVILAGMINRIPLNFSLDPIGIISFALFAIAFIIGHVFALALGAFESSIQSLRLHYVEFFSKFYKGGGIAFTPIKWRKR
jgi:V/A-type H+-transporting ATPase subunit I